MTKRHTIEDLELEISRYRVLSRAVYASAMLWMYHRTNPAGSGIRDWEKDRFEAYLEILAIDAGVDLEEVGDRKELLKMLEDKSDE